MLTHSTCRTIQTSMVSVVLSSAFPDPDKLSSSIIVILYVCGLTLPFCIHTPLPLPCPPPSPDFVTPTSPLKPFGRISGYVINTTLHAGARS